jgi:hypothetical protein
VLADARRRLGPTRAASWPPAWFGSFADPRTARHWSSWLVQRGIWRAGRPQARAALRACGKRTSVGQRQLGQRVARPERCLGARRVELSGSRSPTDADMHCVATDDGVSDSRVVVEITGNVVEAGVDPGTMPRLRIRTRTWYPSLRSCPATGAPKSPVPPITRTAGVIAGRPGRAPPRLRSPTAARPRR